MGVTWVWVSAFINTLSVEMVYTDHLKVDRKGLYAEDSLIIY